MTPYVFSWLLSPPTVKTACHCRTNTQYACSASLVLWNRCIQLITKLATTEHRWGHPEPEPGGETHAWKQHFCRIVAGAANSASMWLHQRLDGLCCWRWCQSRRQPTPRAWFILVQKRSPVNSEADWTKQRKHLICHMPKPSTTLECTPTDFYTVTWAVQQTQKSNGNPNDLGYLGNYSPFSEISLWKSSKYEQRVNFISFIFFLYAAAGESQLYFSLKPRRLDSRSAIHSMLNFIPKSHKKQRCNMNARL